jgi:hypothetical protein
MPIRQVVCIEYHAGQHWSAFLPHSDLTCSPLLLLPLADTLVASSHASSAVLLPLTAFPSLPTISTESALCTIAETPAITRSKSESVHICWTIESQPGDMLKAFNLFWPREDLSNQTPCHWQPNRISLPSSWETQTMCLNLLCLALWRR